MNPNTAPETTHNLESSLEHMINKLIDMNPKQVSQALSAKMAIESHKSKQE